MKYKLISKIEVEYTNIQTKMKEKNKSVNENIIRVIKEIISLNN